jgi:quinol monooxygenase YgiN
MNNIGCALLERHCHPQAHSTFRDALQLVRLKDAATGQAAAAAGGPDAERALAASLPTFDSGLRQAEKQLSNPEPSPFALPSEALAFHASSPDVRAAVAAAESAACCLRPLRIEACGTGADGGEIISLVVLSCILMLNLAVSSLSVIKGDATAQRNPSSLSANLGCVLGFLTLASRLTEQIFDTSYQGLFLLVATLDSTVRVLTEAGEVDEARTARLRLREAVRYVQGNISYLFTDHPAATAA